MGVLVNLTVLTELWLKFTHIICAFMNVNTDSITYTSYVSTLESSRRIRERQVTKHQSGHACWMRHSIAVIFTPVIIYWVELIAAAHILSFILASRRPRIPGPGSKQRHPTEEEIPLYTKKATAHQQIKKAVHSEAKCILLMVITHMRKDIFTFCERVCSHCRVIGSKRNGVMF